MTKLRTIASLLLTASLMGTASADILVLVDGTRLEGRVDSVSGTREFLAFTSGTGRIEFPLSRIKERIEESDAQDWTRVGNQFLDAKNLTFAVQMFQKALEADAEFKPAAEGLTRAQEAINAQQEARRTSLQEGIAKELDSIDGLIKTERFKEGQEVLAKVLASDTASDEQRTTAQRMLRDLHLAWAYSRWDRTDAAGAEEQYQRVLEMDPTNEEARDRLLLIWKDNPSKRPEVLKAYLAKLAEDPNNLQTNQIAGDLLYREERWEEAIEPFTKVSSSARFAGQGYDAKLRRAYQMAINKRADQGNLDAAINLSQQMFGVFPNEDRTNLTILTYERDKSRLASDDYDGKAALARRLYNEGLTQYAEREAQLILRYAPDNATAVAILRSEAESRFQRIQENFQAQEYQIALNLASNFIQNEKRFGDLVNKADEIMRKADIEIQRTQRANRETASRIAENGITAYNEALRYVDQMTDSNRRSDTYVVSPKQQAIVNAQRAVERFDTALKLDPTIGPPSGMDITARRRDAVSLLSRLTAGAIPLTRKPVSSSR
ncbi:hypothetical protein GC173_18970 [bacterium]|nr:hypothetical protein [bacterium]